MSQDFLGKKFVLKSSENFDAYMKELGVGEILRKMGNTIIPKCVLIKNNDESYTFTLETPYHCSSIRFKLDKEFKEVTLDNRIVKTVCHLKDNVFVQEQRAAGLKTTKIIREYKDDELITTLTVGDVQAVRVYGVAKETGADRIDFFVKKQ